MFQFSVSGSSLPSEPAMVVIPPREQYLTSYTLNIPPPSTGLFQNNLFVITRATEIMNIYLNESPIGSNNWDPTPANPGR